MQWRSQGARDDRAVGYQESCIQGTESTQVNSSKAGGEELSKPLNIKIPESGHEAIGLGIPPARSCRYPPAPVSPFFPFEMVMYIPCHYMLDVYNLMFYFTGVIVEIIFEPQGDFKMSRL